MNLAPNGKPSNLNPEQYLLVRTPEFKAWFGDWENAYETGNYDNVSKVIDEVTKEPLVVYHGTSGDFNVFDVNNFNKNEKSGDYIGEGFYFTNEKNKAKQYGFNTKSFFLKSKNPILINDYNYFKKIIEDMFGFENVGSVKIPYYYQLKKQNASKIRNKFIEFGYDGLIDNLYNQYAVFEPTQIKLADGTNTTFDSNNPDIRYANGGMPKLNLIKTYLHYDEYNDTEYLAFGYNHNRVFAIGKNKFSESFMKETIREYYNNVSIIKFGKLFRKHINPYFSAEFNKERIRPNFSWKELSSYIIGDGDYSIEYEQFLSFCKDANINLPTNPNTTFDSNNSDTDIRYSGGGETPYVSDNFQIGYDGAYEHLTAPNGKLSNLTPEQYRIVRTPEFKAWFGDWENDAENMILDENGEPKVLWRGDSVDFNVFDLNKTFAGAFWFTPSKEYGSMRGKYNKPYFIKSDKIIDLSKDYERGRGTLFEDIDSKNVDINSVYITSGIGSEFDEYVCFNPNNIKLADGTNTTFDSNNPDIRFELGGLYHGSPNNFCNNGFDTNKVGSSFSKGAMGWGIYFTSEKDIADRYSKIPSEEQGISYDEAIKLMVIGKKVIGKRIISRDGDKDDSHKALILIYPKYVNELRDKNSFFGDIKWFKNIDYPNVYKVTLHKGKSSLEYDYAESILTKRQILKIKIQAKKENLDLNIDNPNDYLYIVYNYLSEKLGGERSASLFLLRAGIDGIKYPCNYTDLIDEEKMDNCYNYVVFDSENIIIDECINPDIRYAEGGSVINRNYFDDGNKLVVFSAYRNYEPYKIAVNDVNNAEYITLWKTDTNTGKDKKVGALKLEDTTIGRNSFFSNSEISWLNNTDFLKVSYIEIDKSSRGLGLGLEMYKVALKYSSDNIKGIKSYLPDRVNKRQIPKIYKALNGKIEDNDYAYIYKADNLGKFKKGGSVKNLSKTPAPKKDRIYGSSKNKPKSSESKSKASSIILSPTVIKSINTILKEHNEDFPKKKIPLSTAKAVVRRGMGAFSSSYRPTISGGKPNSRVAWGLARLKAFVYKIQKGHSKSGKYKQDNDLIDELGYKHDEYKNGGEMQKIDDLYKDHHNVWAISEKIIKNVCEENCSKYSDEIHYLYELELKPHFIEEEKVFFPSVINENNKDLIKELIKEHHLIKFLAQKIKLSKKTKDIKDFCNLMIEHIKKEELIMKTISDDPYKNMAFKNGGNIPKFNIESREGEEDRTTISIKGIGEIVLVETFPEYEFTEDIDEDTLSDLGLSEGDMIGKIEHIEIKDEYKGKGYAKLLMKKAIELAKQKGLMPLYLNSSPMGSKRYGLSLEDLTGFYESFGFKVFLNQGNNNLMILKEQDVKFNEGGLTMKAPKEINYSLRYYIPNVRGGWTKEKIRKVLKSGFFNSAYGKNSINRLIAEFDSPEDFKEHIFYHGTGSYVGGALLPSITMSESYAQRYGGGGYGDRYWSISLSKSKNVASNFTALSRSGTVYAVILKKGANVINMPEIKDSNELEDIIEELWTKGIDAVWIGGGEQELSVLNPRAIFKYDVSESFMVYGKERFENLTDEQIAEIYYKAKENVSYMDKIKSLPKDERVIAYKEIKPFKFNEGGNIEEYKYFLVTKNQKPVFKVKFSKYKKETERDMSEMLDKLYDMDYILKSITEQEYKDFDYGTVDKEDIAEFTKNWSYYKNGGKITDERKETYKKWKSLVNMSSSELNKFLDSEEGKVAGLSRKEANELGIDYGRESARWILRMKDTPYSEWTPNMWRWAKKQISFISRMSGNKGKLFDENGKRTRKYLSLLVWGNNPLKK